MRTFLSGMPELRLGLNDRVQFESTGRSMIWFFFLFLYIDFNIFALDARTCRHNSHIYVFSPQMCDFLFLYYLKILTPDARICGHNSHSTHLCNTTQNGLTISPQPDTCALSIHMEHYSMRVYHCICSFCGIFLLFNIFPFSLLQRPQARARRSRWRMSISISVCVCRYVSVPTLTFTSTLSIIDYLAARALAFSSA